MDEHRSGIAQALTHRGFTRRQFVKLCGAMAAVLALPATERETIVRALETAPRLPVIWLEFQDCTGDSESLLRAAPRTDAAVSSATDPSITDLLLDVISVEYHETIMAPAGEMAEKSREDVLAKYAGQFLCVVEGSIPTANDGIYCTISGRTALSILREVCAQARAVVAMGTCATDGGLAGAAPNPTGATGVRGAVTGLKNLVALPGCPANVVNLTASIVYLLTYNALPPRDSMGRPKFAYDDEIHEHCERHEFYEAKKFVLAWGDEGHRNGWCLKKMGCRGPQTSHNCPRVRWNEGTCWPVAAGHGCLGCARPGFWDALTPFYVAYGGQGGDDDDHAATGRGEGEDD